MSQQDKESRCLGLVGGLGPATTVFYYRELVAAIERQGRVPRLLVAHADINRVYAVVTAKDYDGLARYLAGLIDSMKAGGAELTAIVAATPHIAARQLAALSPLPLISMLTAVADTVRTQGLKRVALFGTRFTIETRMFGCLDGVDVIMPAPEVIERIHRLYTEVVGGRGTPAHIEEMRKLAQAFVRDGAQAILIAGTDLSPLLADVKLDFPAIDCARVHIDAIVQRLIS